MKYTKDIIALIIILAGVLSLFISTTVGAVDLLKPLIAVIIGYYFGNNKESILKVFKKKSGRK